MFYSLSLVTTREQYTNVFWVSGTDYGYQGQYYLQCHACDSCISTCYVLYALIENPDQFSYVTKAFILVNRLSEFTNMRLLLP